jgi:hypothetical protein
MGNAEASSSSIGRQRNIVIGAMKRHIGELQTARKVKESENFVGGRTIHQRHQ